MSPLRVRGLDRVRPHADLTILAKLACALATTRATARGAISESDGFILVVLALISVVALALLVLGLLNVEVVTDHFRIH
jgi:hypothetical protein